ncbi:MAG: hypothetical protein R3B39_02865 [Candidatus Paceibacterota bacterium]
MVMVQLSNFLRDIQLNTTIIASKDSSGVLGNGVSGNSVVSEDGRYVFLILLHLI